MQDNSDRTQDTIDVGGRLREMRTERGLSIRSLAKMSGLNVNTLSLIENGKSSPSVSTIQQIALALNAPIASFFEIESPLKSIVFQKFGHRRGVNFYRGVVEDLGAGLALGGSQPLLVALEANANSGANPIVHTGHEFVYCLEGKLVYTIEDKKFLLESGDSLFFEAHLPHRWQNGGGSTTLWLLVLCPTDENDRPTERHFAPGKRR